MNDELFDEMNDEMDAELYGTESVSIASQERIEGYLVSDIELCVDRNTEYYLDCFRKQPQLYPNGSALLFSGNWMVYRHMWVEFLIWNLIDILLTFVSGLIFIKPMLLGGERLIDIYFKLNIWNFVFVAILFFAFANTFYWKKIKRELNRFNRKDSTTPITEEEKAVLQNHTRVSGLYVVIAILLYLLIGRLCNSVLMAALR